MTPRLRLAEAARQLDPSQQGQLDGLCGLYAIINAVELAIYPGQRLQLRHRKQLFASGIRFLSARRKLHTTITSGMGEALWVDLAKHILAQNPEIRARSDVLRVGRTVDAAIQAIISALKHGYPVALSLTGTYDHFSVDCGYTQTRFTLFDSWGYRSIEQRSLGLAGRRLARHAITRSAVLVFMRC